MSRPLNTLADWRNYFQSVGLGEDAVSVNCALIERQLIVGVPVIFETEHLSQLLGVHAGFFDFCLARSAENYRVFDIPKRRGGERRIVAPKQVLKRCQRWVNANILASQPLGSAVRGFVKGRSVLSHAKAHHKKKFVLVIDVENFFPSINFGRVYSVFFRLGYTKKVATALAAICCNERVLPQGAPTSPALSNLVCWRLDKRLSALAAENRLVYTRYADDMAFSGAAIRKGFELQVYEILKDEGFFPNLKKSRLIRPKGQRIITGIAIARDRIRVPREYKRKLKQEVHFVLRFGIVSHCLNRNIRSPGYLDTLLGRLAYWRQVEPSECEPQHLYEQVLALKKQLS